MDQKKDVLRARTLYFDHKLRGTRLLQECLVPVLTQQGAPLPDEGTVRELVQTDLKGR